MRTSKGTGTLGWRLWRIIPFLAAVGLTVVIAPLSKPGRPGFETGKSLKQAILEGGNMPNRIIKESLCVSEKIASLSDFEFRLWVGLITAVDDAGRGDARAAIIKGRVFPLRERITIKDIDAALTRLAAKGCVSLYRVDGKPYFWFPTWSQHQRIRDCKPKYPAPDEQDSLRQAAADCGHLPLESESNPNPNPNPESESESNPKSQRATVSCEQIRGLYNEICKSYPRCITLSEARKNAIKARLEAGYSLEDFGTLFCKAEASSFLKGKNERSWRANFDWLLKDANMAKTLDGLYDGDTRQNPNRLDDLDDLF